MLWTENQLCISTFPYTCERNECFDLNMFHSETLNIIQHVLL